MQHMNGVITAHVRHTQSSSPDTPKVSLEALGNLHTTIQAVNDHHAVHPFFVADDERLVWLLDQLASHVDGWLMNTTNRNGPLSPYFDRTPPNFFQLELSANQICMDIRHYVNLVEYLKPSVQIFGTVMIERAEGSSGHRRLVMYRNPMEAVNEEYVFFELEPEHAPEKLTEMGFNSFNKTPIVLSPTDTMQDLVAVHNTHVAAHASGYEPPVHDMYATRASRPASSTPSTLKDVADRSGVEIKGVLKNSRGGGGYKRNPNAKAIHIGNNAELFAYDKEAEGNDVRPIQARIETVPDKTHGVKTRGRWIGPNGVVV